MVQYCTAAGGQNFFYTYAAENPDSAWTSGSFLRSLLYPSAKHKTWLTAEGGVKTPLSETLNKDYTDVRRTYLECRIGLVDAYCRTFDLDVGNYYVGKPPEEDFLSNTLLRRRLDDYRKLCIKEFLGLSFKEYLASPRHVIAEYNTICTVWASDPDIAKLKAEEDAKKLLGG